MRIFTKSLLALAMLFVANAVSAQRVWQKIFSEGWAHEWRTPDAQTKGAALTDSEGAYKVYVRSSEGVEGFVAWDSQFFITWGEANKLETGDKIRVRMKIKADVEPSGTIDTQAHNAPGDYNHYAAIGNITFTTEYTDFDSGEVEVTSNMAFGSENNKPGFWSIAFNLGKGEENTFYFKDIIVEIYAAKKTTKTVVSSKMQWTELVTNGDIESDDVTSFYTRTYPYVDGEPSPHSELVDGVGVDGTRGVRVVTKDKVEQAWDTQFWIRLNEEIPAGTTLSVNFDYRADNDAKTTTQIHTSKPGENSYIHYVGIGDVNFTTDWQHFGDGYTLKVSGDQSKEGQLMGSIAFNMNENSDADGNATGPANVYYLDNISVKKGVLINDISHFEEGIQVLFTAYTNIPDLILESANGKRRLVLEGDDIPFRVFVDGTAIPIQTVEYDRDGQVYIFPDEDYISDNPLTSENNVSVKFVNPENAKYRIIYTNGDNTGNAVEDFELGSVYNGELDFLPFAYGKAEIESTDPEEGSFNLPATISEFKVKFDKDVQCKFIEAKLDGKEKLTVEFAADEAEDIVLKRSQTAALEAGKHTITIDKVYSKTDVQRIEASSFTLNFSVGTPQMPEDLQYALEKANNTLLDNEDERYDGAAFTALKEAVDKYTAEGPNYTAPSIVKEAVTDLALKEEGMKTHRANCDAYDTSLQSAVELVNNYGEGKFASTELYGTLKEAVGKYDGKVLKDDEELVAAVADLKDNVAAGQNMFTEGVSNNGDAGIKVLVDRIRQGAESLVALGVSEEDDLIVAANNALTDDDELANSIKNRLKTIVYEKLKDGDNSLFVETIDDDGNELLEGPDMTVFVKNPNMYALYPADGINPENTPGWERLNGDMGLYGSGGAKWGNPRNIDGLPEDCAFTIYQADTRAEQTITDLPAGRYIVSMIGTDWGNKRGDDLTGPDAQGFVYAKTSDTPVPEEGEEEDRDTHFAATKTIEYAGQYKMDKPHDMEVTVVDGQLTIGMQFKGDSQYFFGDVKLQLVGAADGFNYVMAYESLINSIDDAKANSVRAIELFDLNGRRITKATKGLNIVKKLMGDGTVKTEKVIK